MERRRNNRNYYVQCLLEEEWQNRTTTFIYLLCNNYLNHFSCCYLFLWIFAIFETKAVQRPNRVKTLPFNCVFEMFIANANEYKNRTFSLFVNKTKVGGG